MDERRAAVQVTGVDKTFWVPQQHLMTVKERALHPFRRTPHNELRALRDIAFEIGEGEFFGIVGRNGSGKSTLLKCLAGIYAIDSGEIRIEGRVVPFIELGVGFNMEMTAYDNVVINGVMMGMSPREARACFDEVIEFAELGHALDLKLKNYSSGMQVRLAFALMIQARSDVLLIDEVLAVGDAAFQQKCFDTFAELRDRGKTIVLVTHDMSMIERFCHRALLIHDSRVEALGDPGQVARRYLDLNFAAEAEEEKPASPDDTAREARIGRVWLERADRSESRAFEQGDPLRVRAEIDVLRAIVDPELGITIHREDGTLVFGTTTRLEAMRVQPLSAGDLAEISLELENPLQPGRYFVDCGVHEGENQVAAFAWRAASFMVYGTRPQPGLVTLPHTLTVDRRPASERTPQAAS